MLDGETRGVYIRCRRFWVKGAGKPPGDLVSLSHKSYGQAYMEEAETRFHFWQKWLTYANVMTIGVGLLVAFAGNAWVFEPHNHYTKEVFLDGKAFEPHILEFKNWLFGVIGGTIVGFHVLMVMISEHAFKKKEAWAYRAMWYGLLSWFVIDSGISMYTGALHNVLMINIIALGLIGIPLVMTRKDFAHEPDAGPV